MKKILIIICWLCCGVTAAGLGNATVDYDYRWTTKQKCEQIAAEDQSFMLMIGLLGGPFSLFWTTAFSGFGHNGWSLKRHECNYG